MHIILAILLLGGALTSACADGLGVSVARVAGTNDIKICVINNSQSRVRIYKPITYFTRYEFAFRGRAGNIRYKSEKIGVNRMSADAIPIPAKLDTLRPGQRVTATVSYDRLSMLIENSLIYGRKRRYNVVRFITLVATEPTLSNGVEGVSHYYDLSLYRVPNAVSLRNCGIKCDIGSEK